MAIPKPNSFERLKEKYKNAELASDYRKRFAKGGRKRSTAYIWKALQKALGSNPQSVLDVPCGTGRFTFSIRKAGHRIVAADYSREMVHEAKNHPEGERPPFVRCDVRQLPFPDKSFDITMSIRFFHLLHPEDRVVVLRELRRVARDKVVAVYYPRHTVKQLGRWLRFKLGFSKKLITEYYPWRKIQDEFARAGMEVVALHPACRWFIDDWVVVGR